MQTPRKLNTALFAGALLVSITAIGFAEPAVIEVVSIQAGHDQRTGKPVLNLVKW